MMDELNKKPEAQDDDLFKTQIESKPAKASDDLFKTTIEPLPEEKKKEEPAFDPYSTSFVDAANLPESAKPAAEDMYKTTLGSVPEPPPTGNAILSFIPQSLALGFVNNQAVTQLEISVRNSGDGHLQGRVVPRVDWLEVVGNNKIDCGPRVITKFTIRVKRGLSAPVANEALLDLQTNAQNTPEGSITVYGSYTPPPMVSQDLTVTPDKLNLPPISPERMGTALQATLSVSNHTSEPMSVSVRVNRDWLKFENTAFTLAPQQTLPVIAVLVPSEIPDLRDGQTARGTVQFVVEGKPQLTLQREISLTLQTASSGTPTPQAEGPSPVASMMSALEDVTLPSNKWVLWGTYLGLVGIGLFGFVLALRMLVLIVIFGHFPILPIVFGILGAAVTAGAFFAVKFVPPLIGLEERIDQLETEAERMPLISSIQEPRATIGPWFIAMVVLIVVAGLLGGLWAFNQPIYDVDEDELEGFPDDIWVGFVFTPVEGHEDVKETFTIGAIIFGVLGGATVSVLGGMSEKHPPITGQESRSFVPLYLARPLAVGGGLVLFAVALGLIGHNAWDIPLYLGLVVVGVIGIAGSSLRSMPLRLHQWTGRLQIGLLVGVAVIAAMSVLTLLVDTREQERVRFENGDEFVEVFDDTFRNAYSPAYFVATARDHNLLKAGLLGIGLGLVGVLATWIVLQAFGYNVMGDRQQRRIVGVLLGVSLLVVSVPMVLIWLILILLPLGFTVEGWLIWGIPFLLLSGLMMVLRTRGALVDRVMGMFQNLVSKINGPPAITAPLQKFAALRSHDIRPQITWQLGFAVVVAGSLLVAPLVVSIWFWIPVILGFFILLNSRQWI